MVASLPARSSLAHVTGQSTHSDVSNQMFRRLDSISELVGTPDPW